METIYSVSEAFAVQPAIWQVGQKMYYGNYETYRPVIAVIKREEIFDTGLFQIRVQCATVQFMPSK